MEDIQSQMLVLLGMMNHCRNSLASNGSIDQKDHEVVMMKLESLFHSINSACQALRIDSNLPHIPPKYQPMLQDIGSGLQLLRELFRKQIDEAKRMKDKVRSDCLANAGSLIDQAMIPFEELTQLQKELGFFA